MGKGKATPGISSGSTQASNPVRMPLSRLQLSSYELNSLYTPDHYQCSLTPDLLKAAQAELNEDDHEREQKLDWLRSWIAKTDYITDCRLDANFLLRFLRVKKFNIIPAFDMLVNYIKMRQSNPVWFRNLSLAEPKISDLIDQGVVFALPERDKHGRRVVFTIGGKIDPAKQTSEDVMRALMLTVECLLESEENQIRGFSHILDESGLSLQHLRLWRPIEIKKVLTACERSMPMRHKSFDFVALPAALRCIYEVVTRTVITPKLRDRITLHRNRTALLEQIDRRILPAEYGGTIPMRDMIAAFRQELINSGNGRTLARVAALDRMNLNLEIMKHSDRTSLNLMMETHDLDKLDIDSRPGESTYLQQF